MPFLKGGRHLWTHFSQSFSDKNEEFLCSSERKFPELFKTHPTFVYSPLLVPSMACQTQRGVFFETPCSNILSRDSKQPLVDTESLHEWLYNGTELKQSENKKFLLKVHINVLM